MTKAQWEALSEKGQWDIKVALRGPDSNYGETLKWFTASVIRGQMRNVFRVGGLVNADLQLVILPYGNDAPADLQGSGGWNYEHYLDHIRVAASYLGLRALYVEPKLWHKCMRLRSAMQAGERILEAAAAFRTEDNEHSYYYKQVCIDELSRHLKSGEVRF